MYELFFFIVGQGAFCVGDQGQFVSCLEGWVFYADQVDGGSFGFGSGFSVAQYGSVGLQDGVSIIDVAGSDVDGFEVGNLPD